MPDSGTEAQQQTFDWDAPPRAPRHTPAQPARAETKPTDVPGDDIAAAPLPSLSSIAERVCRLIASAGGQLKATQKEIAELLDVHPSHARRALSELKGKGIVNRRAKHRSGVSGTWVLVDRAGWWDVGPLQLPLHERAHSTPVSALIRADERAHLNEPIEISKPQSLIFEGSALRPWAFTADQLANPAFVDDHVIPAAIQRFQLPDCVETVQGIQAAAVCAVKHPKAKNPPAMFTKFVERRAWQNRGKGGIAEKWFDAARTLRRPVTADAYSKRLAADNEERQRKDAAIRKLNAAIAAGQFGGHDDR